MSSTIEYCGCGCQVELREDGLLWAKHCCEHHTPDEAVRRACCFPEDVQLRSVQELDRMIERQRQRIREKLGEPWPLNDVTTLAEPGQRRITLDDE